MSTVLVLGLQPLTIDLLNERQQFLTCGALFRLGNKPHPLTLYADADDWPSSTRGVSDLFQSKVVALSMSANNSSINLPGREGFKHGRSHRTQGFPIEHCCNDLDGIVGFNPSS